MVVEAFLPYLLMADRRAQDILTLAVHDDMAAMIADADLRNLDPCLQLPMSCPSRIRTALFFHSAPG